jgi:hypothetical protein
MARKSEVTSKSSSPNTHNGAIMNVNLFSEIVRFLRQFCGFRVSRLRHQKTAKKESFDKLEISIGTADSPKPETEWSQREDKHDPPPLPPESEIDGHS